MEYLAYFPFGGIGAGARGFIQARSEKSQFRALGGVDIDEDACRDFERLVGVKERCGDVSKMTVRDVHEDTGGETPDVVFLSPPCKGFSGLLPKAAMATEKYQALNRLVLEGVHLVLSAFARRLPKLILIENVPLIARRGAELLLHVRSMLAASGYAFHEGYHDCGELGGLAQHRRRYLLIARQTEQVPAFVYRPRLQRVRTIGEVIGPMPMPDDPRGGPMHRLQRLKWKTWVRLALIPAGSDWRALGTKNGKTPFNNQFRIVPFDRPSVAVTGGGTPTAGGVCVADPRFDRPYNNGAYGVVEWDEASGVVTGNGRPAAGSFTIADPRLGCEPRPGAYRVERWDGPSGTVTGSSDVHQGTVATVSDPRFTHGPQAHWHKYRVERWDEPAHTVMGSDRIGSGAPSVGDPRINGKGSRPDLFGVLSWDQPAKTINGSASVSGGNCPSAVADPRIPGDDDRPDPPPVIVALDGTWHRPLTTLELAALQGLPVFDADGVPLVLSGRSHEAWRERIGNAVPPPAARAIAEVMLDVLDFSGGVSVSRRRTRNVWVHPEIG